MLGALGLALGVRTLVFLNPGNTLSPVAFVILFFASFTTGYLFQTEVYRENQMSLATYETKYRLQREGKSGGDSGRV